MTGKITKIDPLKQSRNKNSSYYRVYFEIYLSDGTTKWTKTDLVPTYRNFAKWKPLLKTGNIITGIVLKQNDTVDADSPVRIVMETTPLKVVSEAIKQSKLF